MTCVLVKLSGSPGYPANVEICNRIWGVTVRRLSSSENVATRNGAAWFP